MKAADIDSVIGLKPTPQQRFRAMLGAFHHNHSFVESPPHGEQAAGSIADDDFFRGHVMPYPGLRSFSPREGGVFFGRERSVNEIRDRLSQLHVAVVLGASGSGKSSVVRAGLMPRLNSTKGVRGRAGNWYAAEFRPRLQPMQEMLCALADMVDDEFPQKGGAPNQQAALVQLQEISRTDGRASSPFKEREARAAALCDALFDFVEIELDRLDRTATQGLRAGRPNLLLVVDQFEEVFRPEVTTNPDSGGTEFLDLLLAAFTRLEREGTMKSDARSGLFIVVTLRSEELHRCTEYPSLRTMFDEGPENRSLADMVNSSVYLLDLLDPEQDRDDLREAIIKPAKQIFSDWGLPLNRANPDAPFEKGVPDWLLQGAQKLSLELEHRPDQLPLLQHALQTIWHAALDDWAVSDERQDFVIRKDHLPGPAGATASESDGPDLAAVLDRQADSTARDAASKLENAFAPDPVGKEHAAGEPRIEYGPGRAAIRAAFRALAQNDDRGNWARRFADIHQIAAFARADPLTASIPPSSLEESLAIALQIFVSRGYLVVKDGQYDISHEALIRNWKQYQDWLRIPSEVSQTLVKTVTDLEPAALEVKSEEAERQLIFSFPATVRDRLSMLLRARILPEAWALDYIAPLLKRPTVASRWNYVRFKYPNDGSDGDAQFGKAILRRIRDFIDQAEDALSRVAGERERNRLKLRRIVTWASGITGLALAAVVGTYFIQGYAAKRASVERLITFAQHDSSSGFRFRLLLLLDALSQAGGLGSVSSIGGATEEALQKTLARSPTFGGTYDAVGISSDGNKLALLKSGKLTIRNLTNESSSDALEVKWPERDSSKRGEYTASTFELPIVGFLQHPELKEIPAVYRDGTVVIWIDGASQGFDVRQRLPEGIASGNFRIVELAGSLRFTVNSTRGEDGNARFETRVFELGLSSEEKKLDFKPVRPKPVLVPSVGRFVPTIATACDVSAFLRPAPGGANQKLVVGRLGKEGGVEKDPDPPAEREDAPGSSFNLAMGFSNDCKRLAVRTSRALITSMPIDSDDKGIHLGEFKNITLPESAQNLVLPFFPRNRPLLAVAEPREKQLRFAWLVPGGVMVHTSDDDPSAPNQPLVTGLDNAVKLQFGNNGKILTAVQQTWGANSLAQVRTWYLDRKPVDREKLIAETCRVAALETGAVTFTKEEHRIWFTDSKPQPCEGKEKTPPSK